MHADRKWPHFLGPQSWITLVSHGAHDYKEAGPSLLRLTTGASFRALKPVSICIPIRQDESAVKGGGRWRM